MVQSLISETSVWDSFGGFFFFYNPYIFDFHHKIDLVPRNDGLQKDTKVSVVLLFKREK